MLLNIPTSKDIYIEIDGKRVAVVESYKAKTTREATPVHEFGNDSPVCYINGSIVHTLELRRVYFTNDSEVELNFFELSNFTVGIVKPNKRIIYTGCEWQSINEGIAINTPCIENILVTATRRVEL